MFKFLFKSKFLGFVKAPVGVFKVSVWNQVSNKFPEVVNEAEVDIDVDEWMLRCMKVKFRYIWGWFFFLKYPDQSVALCSVWCMVSQVLSWGITKVWGRHLIEGIDN